ncbi:MAG: LytTR family DNA-binding domain-containing protein [Gammaproteobacteria bacterium]
MLRLLIADGDSSARNILRNYLKNEHDINVIGECADEDEVREKFHILQPDIFITSTEVADTSAFDILKSMDRSTFCNVIFTSPSDKYAVRAFEINALDYLLKPLAKQRVHNAITKARRYAQLNELETNNKCVGTRANNIAEMSIPLLRERVPMRTGRRIRFLSTLAIRYVSADHDRANVHMITGETILTSERISQLEQKLATFRFRRIQRSIIVNLKHVQEIVPIKCQYKFVMHGGESFMSGILYKRELQNLLLTWELDKVAA